MARAFATEEFVAVATSALREAGNQNKLLHLLRMEAQIDVTGHLRREEARLIYLGVAGATRLGEKKAFFIDIGGGSTEISIGGEMDYQYLESLQAGSTPAH